MTRSRREARGRSGGRGRAAILLACFLAMTGGGCAVPRWPVQNTLTSPFGLRWNGILPDLHAGVDIRAAEGTPVRTMAPGRVRYAGWMDGYGNVVWVDHAGGVISVYAHLSDIDVSQGTAIGGGDLVGLSGSTGTVTGPHLHFEVWKSGRQVDPVSYIGGRPSVAATR